MNLYYPTMNIRRDELDAVAKVFPKFAAARKEEITARVFCASQEWGSLTQ
ncbi:MAG: hypothetical protein V9G22_05620 [Ottowia sp.]